MQCHFYDYISILGAPPSNAWLGHFIMFALACGNVKYHKQLDNKCIALALRPKMLSVLHLENWLNPHTKGAILIPAVLHSAAICREPLYLENAILKPQRLWHGTTQAELSAENMLVFMLTVSCRHSPYSSYTTNKLQHPILLQDSWGMIWVMTKTMKRWILASPVCQYVFFWTAAERSPKRTSPRGQKSISLSYLLTFYLLYLPFCFSTL